MNITISTASQAPIYQQLVDRIKALILGGELKPGDPLPSMRVLAKELRISVITTKRAYEELEREGLISSVTGKGSFVRADNAALIREVKLREMESHLKSAGRLAALCSLEKPEYVRLAGQLYGCENDDI